MGLDILTKLKSAVFFVADSDTGPHGACTEFISDWVTEGINPKHNKKYQLKNHSTGKFSELEGILGATDALLDDTDHAFNFSNVWVWVAYFKMDMEVNKVSANGLELTVH